MAIFHLSVQVIGRSSGRSSTAAAAYRAGCRIVDERTGEVFDFTRKGGVREAFVLAPPNSPAWMQDRSVLWNAVECVEKRKDAQLTREIEVSLPHELSHEQRRGLLVEFADDEFVGRGMVADIAMHAPGKEGDRRNEHAHILLTMRRIEGDGFGHKAREWNDKDLVEHWREVWAQRVNQALAAHAVSSRVDHRSFERQALAVGHDIQMASLATVHLGPNASQLERRGIRTVPGDLNREVQVMNLELERTRRSLQDETEIPVSPAPEPVTPICEDDLVLRRELLQRQLQGALGLSQAPDVTEARAAIEKQREEWRREELPTWKAWRLNRHEALRAATLRLEAAQAVARTLIERQDKLRILIQQLRHQTEQIAAALLWRRAHPVRAWLHGTGLWRTPTAVLAGDPGTVPQHLEQVCRNLARVRVQTLDAQAQEQAAFLEQLRVRAQAEEEARQEAEAAVQRLDRGEALANDLQRVEAALELQAEAANSRLRFDTKTPAGPRPG